MTGGTLSFLAFAAVAVIAAGSAMFARRASASLAGFCVALLALIVPFASLGAPLLGALVLALAAMIMATLLGLSRLEAAAPEQRAPRSSLFWLGAGAGLLAFTWLLGSVLSRQFIDTPPTPMAASARQGLTLPLIPSLAVALIALCVALCATLAARAEGRE
ncbi:hypothetical protein G6O69_23345 [Pseudenhygromyxa sp. WMMC2535]|uniref:hypothetical protein n=1 Tax=Pseudenhygromyxa sp. WMMC2535 TaxID=2712867 RepID=UPI0015576620|nr:hypothetical protein [Pseudenhygromyxa sp. WMMC2535]NVB40795.1 hypothetical protein [Pseudenhygromyxa sp. WMMC2535]